MVGTLMTIPIDEYNNLKEYYDFQRKKEFNREQFKEKCHRRNRAKNRHESFHDYLLMRYGVG